MLSAYFPIIQVTTHVVLGQVWMNFAEMLKLSALSICQGVHNQQMCPDLGFIFYVSHPSMVRGQEKEEA